MLRLLQKVHFLAQSDTMATNVPPKALADADPKCDEPVTSKERD